MSESGDLFSEIEEDKKVKKTYDPRVFSSNRKLKVTALLEDEGTWGKIKERYHKDEPSSDEDSEAQEAEEIEADYLAKKQQEKIGQDDYWDHFQEDSKSQDNQEKPTMSTTKFNLKAISSLAKALNIKVQVIEQMENDELKRSILSVWPEILDILNNVDLYAKKLKQTKLILKKTTQRYKKEYIKLKLKSYAAYLTLLLFYLQLRSKTQLERDHPIFQKIVEAKEQVAYVEEMDLHVRLLDSSIKEKKIQKNKLKTKQKIAKQEEQPIIIKKVEKAANLKQKRVDDILSKLDQEDFLNKKQKKNTLIDDDDSGFDDDMMLNDNDDDGIDGIGGEDDFYTQNKEKQGKAKKQKKDDKTQDKLEHFQKLSKLMTPKQVAEDEARTINYVMLKKKSLMQRRRGNRSTNSRVKHKIKYDKALQKQKTMGHLQKNATSAFYSGEKGVKANQIRSVKFK